MSHYEQLGGGISRGFEPRAEAVLEGQQCRWYAAYTSAHHEKRVAQQMKERGIESFLPLYHSVRRWADRRKELELPLFAGYVFVRIAAANRLRVLTLTGVASLISFQGKPAPLADHEIEALQNSLGRNLMVQPHPYLRVGRRVRVRSGSMAGLEGILVRRKDKFRLVLTVELIMGSVAVEIDEADIEPVG